MSPWLFIFRVYQKTSNRGNRRSHAKGLLRMKLEKSQGTIPNRPEFRAAIDAILTSEQKVQIMSCSDKVALWNVVGVQGALLTNFIQPIYIESLVVSNFYRPVQLLRGCHSRINAPLLNSNIGEDSVFRVNQHKVGSSPLNSELCKGNFVSLSAGFSSTKVLTFFFV